MDVRAKVPGAKPQVLGSRISLALVKPRNHSDRSPGPKPQTLRPDLRTENSPVVELTRGLLLGRRRRRQQDYVRCG
jgi:hypothetical protein